MTKFDFTSLFLMRLLPTIAGWDAGDPQTEAGFRSGVWHWWQPAGAAHHRPPLSPGIWPLLPWRVLSPQVSHEGWCMDALHADQVDCVLSVWFFEYSESFLTLQNVDATVITPSYSFISSLKIQSSHYPSYIMKLYSFSLLRGNFPMKVGMIDIKCFKHLSSCSSSLQIQHNFNSNK